MARVTPAGGTMAVPAAAPSNSESDAPETLDVTAETEPDVVGGLDERTIRRAELIMVARKLKDADKQADIDRIHADFDANAAERAEYQREMSVLRDIAMEQQKRDDEILKKWIALI